MDSFSEMRSITVDDDLELKLVSRERVEELYEVVSANFQHLHQWMQWAVEGQTIDDTITFVASSLKQFRNRESINYSIISKGKIVGSAGYNFIDKVNRGTEIGYWLAESETGKGLVTRCVRILVTRAFTELGMQRVTIRCASSNTRSRAIPERLGFSQEGTLRNAEWLHDRFVDLVVYSMLADEWNVGSG